MFALNYKSPMEVSYTEKETLLHHTTRLLIKKPVETPDRKEECKGRRVLP